MISLEFVEQWEWHWGTRRQENYHNWQGHRTRSHLLKPQSFVILVLSLFCLLQSFLVAGRNILLWWSHVCYTHTSHTVINSLTLCGNSSLLRTFLTCDKSNYVLSDCTCAAQQVFSWVFTERTLGKVNEPHAPLFPMLVVILGSPAHINSVVKAIMHIWL